MAQPALKARERTAFINEARHDLLVAMLAADRALDPYTELHAFEPHAWLDSLDTGEMADTFAALRIDVQTIAEDLRDMPGRKQMGRSAAERMTKVVNALFGRGKSPGALGLLGKLTERALNLANNREPSSALVLAFGNPEARTREGRRGLYGNAREHLRHAFVNMFYITEPLRVSYMRLTPRQWNVWNDPIYFDIKHLLQDEATARAKRTGRYVEILSPTDETVFWASPFGDVPGPVLSRRQGKASLMAGRLMPPRREAMEVPTLSAETHAVIERGRLPPTGVLAGAARTGPRGRVPKRTKKELAELREMLAAQAAARAVEEETERALFIEHMLDAGMTPKQAREAWQQRLKRPAQTANPRQRRGALDDQDLAAILWLE